MEGMHCYLHEILLVMLPKNWVRLLVDVQAERHNQAKDQEKKGFITCSK